MVMIGKRIEALRKEKGWTQQTLGDRANISREQISRYEHGKSIPDFQTTIRIAEALEVSIDSLLRGPDSEKEITEEDIRFALSGGEEPITPSQYKEVLAFVKFIRERDKENGNR